MGRQRLCELGKGGSPYPRRSGSGRIRSLPGEHSKSRTDRLAGQNTITVVAPAFEEIARNTGLLQKNYETVPWPDEIPAAYRPVCTVVALEKYESETEGYTTDYVLTVLMDENLKASFRRLRSAYEDNGNYIAFPDATMLTQQHGELDGLEYCCQSGEKLTITYFIP